MLFEITSFQLIHNFFQHLKKNKIDSKDIRVSFFDGKEKRVHTNLIDDNYLFTYYVSSYMVPHNCKLGRFSKIEQFNCQSMLYDFVTKFEVIDPTNKLKIKQGSDFDINRNDQRVIYRERQREKLENICNKYMVLSNALESEYLDVLNNYSEVYSPCYAEPGWSEHTLVLKKIREYFMYKKDLFV
jgi:hypothetical protein